ncbi:MAG: hypothetical protein ASARMPRED_004934 [Alectoria sarmentosa]|nr:MAG: hypothetical protein ASARMPRED_004934 [Alectoria sarmentosa]
MSPKKKGKKAKAAIEKETKTLKSGHVEFVGHASSKLDDEEDIAKVTEPSITQALRQAEEVEEEGGGTVHDNENDDILIQQRQLLHSHSDQIARLQLESKQHAQHFRELQTEVRVLREAPLGLPRHK